MAKPLVGVVLGSRSDFNIMKRGLESLRVMGVPYHLEMASPHRSPERLAKFASSAVEQGLEVIICAAGGGAQVAGIIASHTIIPVVAVPIDSTPLRGQDALYSMVQSPPGIPVATVGINNAENAALLTAQILSLKYPKFRDVLKHQRLAASQRLDKSFKELLHEYPDLCDPVKTAPSYAKINVADDDTDPGADDVTPMPPEPNRSDRIRPGALLTSRVEVGHLVRTPEPQEPGTVTEGVSSEDDTPPERDQNQQYPPPPADADLFSSMETPRTIGGFPKVGEDFAGAALIEAVEEEPLIDTKIFEVDPETPDENVLDHAMMVLLEGGIVALPTDTVYGLAVDAMNPDAVRRLYEVKGYEAIRKSLSVLVHSADLLDSLVREVPAPVESVLEKYWPGGLTVLFYKHPNVLTSVSESPSIAIRIPNNPVALHIMELVGKPLAVINASLGNSPAAVDAHEVTERFDGRIDCVVDAGKCRSSETSTVLSVLSEPYEILREGIVSRADLKRLLGARLKD